MVWNADLRAGAMASYLLSSRKRSCTPLTRSVARKDIELKRPS